MKPYQFHSAGRIVEDGGVSFDFSNGWTASIISRSNIGLLEVLAWKQDEPEEKPDLLSVDQVADFLMAVRSR